MSTVILNGPPGSGKSTVARLLAEESPDGVHLQGDLFWRFIPAHLPPGMPEAEEQNRTVIAALASAAVAFDRGGYEVFLDQFVRPSYLEVFIQAYGHMPLDHVVLMPSLETAVERAVGRGDTDSSVLLTDDELTDPQQIRAQVEQRHGLLANASNALATDGLSTEETAAAIRELVQSGRARITPASSGSSGAH